MLKPRKVEVLGVELWACVDESTGERVKHYTEKQSACDYCNDVNAGRSKLKLSSEYGKVGVDVDNPPL